MQNSNLPGAYDTLRKKFLESRKSRKKEVVGKIKIKKLRASPHKKLETKRAENAQLTNLRLAVELHKKMDAVKQNIRKSN